MPTSRQINAALETLRHAGADPVALQALWAWNLDRLSQATEETTTLDDLRALFDGFDRSTLTDAGIP